MKHRGPVFMVLSMIPKSGHRFSEKIMLKGGQPRRPAMRTILGVLGISIAVALLPAPAAAAPTYRWCANYDGRDIVTCAYDTFQQCLDTASGGAGGYCSENPAWHPAPAAVPRVRAKRKN
jgi:hypothetical protein